MTPKKLFLILFTAAHQILFWFLIFGVMARGAGSSFDLCVRFVVQTMASPLLLLARHSSPFLFILLAVANGFLWALSAWYALTAWRQLCNLPPLRQPS